MLQKLSRSKTFHQKQDLEHAGKLAMTTALALVVSAVLIWAPIHFYLTKTDIEDIRGWLHSLTEVDVDATLKKARCEEETSFCFR